MLTTWAVCLTSSLPAHAMVQSDFGTLMTTLLRPDASIRDQFRLEFTHNALSSPTRSSSQDGPMAKLELLEWITISSYGKSIMLTRMV